MGALLGVGPKGGVGSHYDARIRCAVTSAFGTTDDEPQTPAYLFAMCLCVCSDDLLRRQLSAWRHALVRRTVDSLFLTLTYPKPDKHTYNRKNDCAYYQWRPISRYRVYVRELLPTVCISIEFDAFFRYK